MLKHICIVFITYIYIYIIDFTKLQMLRTTYGSPAFHKKNCNWVYEKCDLDHGNEI
jgi:hypothetical protein